MIEYYERRAPEYDATSWEDPAGGGASAVRALLESFAPATTLDVGCGTGFISRWLPGEVTLVDSSPSMLAIARGRLPSSPAVRAVVPSLPFDEGSFERAFASNFYGHLPPEDRRGLVEEMLRVAGELVILDQLAESGPFREGPEERELRDGTRLTIHKCHFTLERLLDEIRGAEVLMSGPTFAAVRLRSPVA